MHLTSCGTLVILITSSGEFSFYHFTVSFFFFWLPCFLAGVHVPVGKPEAAVISNIDQMEHLGGEQHIQYEGNLSAHRSMRDYRNSPWMNVASCMVPPTNVPYGNSYKSSWRNHLNLSWGPEPPQYAPHTSPSYASSPQSQPPQSISLVEQAILNLAKLVGDVVEEQKKFNAQLSQKIHTVKNSLNQKVDGLQSEIGQKFDNLQKSISRLVNQQVHQEEESQEEECLSGTMVEEQCQQQPLLESSNIGAIVCPWEKNSLMLTEEGSGKEEREEPQKLILQPIPINLDPSATAQPKNSPLPVYILPVAQPMPKEPAPAVGLRAKYPI